MKNWRRKGNISRRWEWLRRWCSEVREVWVGLWVEVFGTTSDLALIRGFGRAVG
jgi:hypothetical protein